MNMESSLMEQVIDGYKDIKADKLLGIFGHPIKHTLSPVIHDNLSKRLSINERYIPFDINDDLGIRVKQAFDEGILGLNITVPFKQDVMNYLVEVDEDARLIGAVNTLVRTDKGYKGYNTDMHGLTKALEKAGINLFNKKIVMLGAGGAARAVAYMCLNEQASKVYIINRTIEKAQAICSDMNKIALDKSVSCEFVSFATEDYKKVPDDSYIFIQCSSVGLKPEDGLPVVDDENFYKMAEAGIDLIYNPAKTPFLKQIEKSGKVAINGLRMLLYQGILAYELWNDVSISEELSEYIYEKLSEKLYGNNKNIVLIGYMGSGKSTVGRYLAEQYGYEFIDTDAYIEKMTNMSISDIFALHGEEFFRNLETEVIKELINSTQKMVISTGGGMPIRECNGVLLKKLGKVYYLKTTADVIYNRIKFSTNRPLLKVDNPREKIENMLNEREKIYSKCSNCVIEMDENSTVSEIADIIITML